MQDGIILGNGNSRFLGSVADFLTRYPNYQAFAQAMAAGTLPIDLGDINENGWYTLGTPLNEETLLTAEVASLFGFDRTAVPNDVFMQLGLGNGNYGYLITLLYPDGSPAAGLSVVGLTDKLGDPLVTDAYGSCLAVSRDTTVTITIPEQLLDIKAKSATFSATGLITKVTVTLEYTDDEVTVTTSGTWKISPTVSTYDLCAVGGGGSGAREAQGTYRYAGGGGGGYVSNALGLARDDNPLVFTIGSGGAATTSTDKLGKSGGTSSVTKNGETLVTATGGGGGTNTDGVLGRGAGGAGNGKGGDGASVSSGNQDEVMAVFNSQLRGQTATVYKFNDVSLGLAGGGGGGGSITWGDNNLNDLIATGGAPYGGNGRCFARDGSEYTDTAATPPTGFGGGSGAGSNGASPGYQGCVYVRFHRAA